MLEASRAQNSDGKVMNQTLVGKRGREERDLRLPQDPLVSAVYSRHVAAPKSFGRFPRIPRNSDPLATTLEELLGIDTSFGRRAIPQEIPKPRRDVSTGGNPVLDLAQRIASEVTAAAVGSAPTTVQNAARGTLLNRVRLLAQQASSKNWDGYGAMPISAAAYEFAIQFARMLPITLPDPEPSVDSDGDVSFEWYRGPRWVFSVSISGAGTLHYAGLFGPNHTHGAEIFSESVPASIALGLARVLGEMAV